MAFDVAVPPLGESVKEAFISKWHRRDGEAVAANEPLVELETDKANVEVRADRAGTLRVLRQDGSVKPGEVIGRIEEGSGAPAAPPVAPVAPAPPPIAKKRQSEAISTPKPAPIAEKRQSADPAPVATHKVAEPATPPSRRRLRRDGAPALEALVRSLAPRAGEARKPATGAAPAGSAAGGDGATGEKRTPMTRLRKRIAERLVEAQRTAAILTTFNEIDMGAVMELRSRVKERFQEVHKVGLGFMSFFARACVLALRDVPVVNSEIRGEDVISRDHVHLGVAVSTDRGLVVPVVRHCERLSFAEIEREIGRLAGLAREQKLAPDDLSGGTFTISNGGVFGSLLSTPILNPPQSGILGMHKIEERPVVKEKQIVIRPMMYVALSYDHRLVDGRDSVTFLVKVKERLEDPARLMLEI